MMQRGVFDSIKIAATAFWDTYLKSAPEARDCAIDRLYEHHPHT
jgi:hypothetical protein